MDSLLYTKSLKNLQQTYKQMVSEDSAEEMMFEINSDVKIGDVNADGFEVVEIYVSDKNERIAKGIKENIIKKGVGKFDSVQQARSDRIDKAVGVTKKDKPGIKRGAKRMAGSLAIQAKDIATLGRNKGRSDEKKAAAADYAKKDKSTFKGAGKGLVKNIVRRYTSG